MSHALNSTAQPVDQANSASAKFNAKSFLASIVVFAALLNVIACVPLILTAATVTAVDVSLDRRTAGTYLDDNNLERKLRRDIGQDPYLVGINASVTAFNGIVLLTGQTNNDAQRQRVSELAEKYKETGEVRKVANELELAGKTNISSRVNDSWITGKVKTRLLQAENLPAHAVKVVTEHGKVYLLGQVTTAEADAAVAAVRTVGGVTHIVKILEYID